MEKRLQLEIEHYSLEELRIEINPDFNGEGRERPSVTVDFDVFSHSTQADQFAVSLAVKSQEPVGPEHPLQFSTRIVGFFRISEAALIDGKLPPERAVNALTILYGIVRSQICTAGGWFEAPIILPTVYFTDLVNEKVVAARKRHAEEGLIAATA
jgi:preprotein translocase subunit SecB